MATPATFSSRPLTIPIGRAAGLASLGLQSRGVASCWRLGPSLPPIPVHGPAHAGGASLLCKQVTSLGVQVVLGLLSVDAASSAGGVHLSCCCWKPHLIAAGCGWKSSTAAVSPECPEVLVSGGAADGALVETRSGAGRRFLQERRAMSLEDIASLYDFPLDEFQASGISSFLEGCSLVVCAPTSSGKTLIAEAAAAAILARGKRLLYTTPLKALSNQKLREFQGIFGEDNVGLLTGDTVWNRNAPIVVMTTEILRNMLCESVGSTAGKGCLADVDAIVLDEVHYLSDISRGTVWEETIIYCPRDVQLICLSATIANPDELVGWITGVHGPTKLVTASTRPVPLQWHFSTRQALLPLLNEESSAINPKLKINHEKESKRLFLDYFGEELSRGEQPSPLRTSVGFGGKNCRESRMQKSKDIEKRMTEEHMMFLRRKQVPKVKDTLMQLKDRDMLPAIWFIFSRKGCDLAVSYVEECNLLSGDEGRQVEEALRKYQQQHPEAIRDRSVKALSRGAAAHHAGCFPTWNAFIEEMFQKGLIKVVFTTETLAAGINMPARTAVLSSMSKRGDSEHALLSSNAMLQMAGRAGRRGVDDQGHVVVMQTPFEGAEECCEVLLAGPEPLVSQFTVTYGMVLNLLAGPRVANPTQHSPDDRSIRVTRRVRTLDETRALIQQSFGNFVGSDVLTSAQQNLASLREEIERLQVENSSEGFLSSLAKVLTKKQLQEYVTLLKRIAGQKDQVKKSEQQLRTSREKMVEQVIVECDHSRLSFLCIEYADQLTGQEHVCSVACVGRFPLESDSHQSRSRIRPGRIYTGFHNVLTKVQTPIQESEALRGEVPICTEEDGESRESVMSVASEREAVCSASLVSPPYVGLGSDNRFYLFTSGSVRTVYNSASLGTTNSGEDVGTLLKDQLQVNSRVWQKAGESGSSSRCAVWAAESRAETLAWACHLLPLHELGNEWQAHFAIEAVMIVNVRSDDSSLQKSPDVMKAEKVFARHNEELKNLNKKLKLTQGFRKYKLLLDLQQKRKDKIANLQSTESILACRMKQLQPSGWKDFLQVMRVLQTSGFLDADSNSLLPLGETAASFRGLNELWLTLIFTRDATCSLKPSQLAAACGALVSEGIKARTKQVSSAKFSESRGVRDWVLKMEDLRSWLLKLQASHGVQTAVRLDKRFAGIVEAWASGISWQELIEHSGLDEGDAARLLRQTLELVSQIPHLPHINAGLGKNARAAREAMDRSPISELFG